MDIAQETDHFHKSTNPRIVHDRHTRTEETVKLWGDTYFLTWKRQLLRLSAIGVRWVLRMEGSVGGFGKVINTSFLSRLSVWRRKTYDRSLLGWYERRIRSTQPDSNAIVTLKTFTFCWGGHILPSVFEICVAVKMIHTFCETIVQIRIEEAYISCSTVENKRQTRKGNKRKHLKRWDTRENNKKARK